MKKGEVARVIAEAERLGFRVSLAESGHLKFTHDSAPTRFFSRPPSDPRAWKNGIAKLRRAARQARVSP